MSDNNTKTFYHDCGKGDRPRGTGWKNYYDNFDAIFGKKNKQEEEDLRISGGALGHGMDAPPMLQVESMASLGGKPGVLMVGDIEQPLYSVSIDAEGNAILKESGCSTTVEVAKADEG